MSNFGDGLGAAIAEVVGSLLAGAILSALSAGGYFGSEYVFLIGIITVIPTLSLIFEMTRWGILYTAGWIFGVLLFSQSGILEWTDYIVYLGVPFTSIGIRIWRAITGN